jgi:glucose-1-phosphate adenylyltransferase
MRGAALGLVVAGGDGPLDALDVAGDAALTPFAGKYRFIDFALATLVNSEVSRVYVAAASSSMLRSYLARAARGVKALHHPFPVRLAGGAGAAARRATRLVRALLGSRHLLETHAPDVVVVLTADHILQLDARHLLEAHRSRGADLTLCVLPLPLDEMAGRAVLRITEGSRVREVVAAPRQARVPIREQPSELTWTGDLVLSGAALPALFAALPFDTRCEDATLLEELAQALHVAAYDVRDNPVPGARHRFGAFWHEPTSLEAYYESQMDLCTPRPALDLYNAAWPVLPVASGLGPAKVVADEAGRAGQALNSLVSDGAVIRGGVVVNTVLGRGVVVESGAEVEDSVLLDGCRIGRGARVRRAVVGAGAVIGDAGEIGYGISPAAPARVVRSGLTVVPAHAEARRALASAR